MVWLGGYNLIRAVKRRSRKAYIERRIQFLYPLELSCDTWKRQKTVLQYSKQPQNVNANDFKPRRNASAIAEVQIQQAKMKQAKMNCEVVCLTHLVK